MCRGCFSPLFASFSASPERTFVKFLSVGSCIQSTLDGKKTAVNKTDNPDRVIGLYLDGVRNWIVEGYERGTRETVSRYVCVDEEII